jgi:hypothetical protein
MKKIDRTVSIISIISNIAVIIGIIFAFAQIVQSNRSEKRLIAIEAVKETRTNDFIKSYTRLKSEFESGTKIKQDNALIDDLNYMMNTYSNIAILYLNDLGDKEIIKNTVYSGVKDFYIIIDSLKLKTNSSEQLRCFIEKMENK